MKTRFLFLLFILMIILPSVSYSQGGYILRRAINRQVEKEVDSLLDKKVQDEQNKSRERQRIEEQNAAKVNEDTGEESSDEGEGQQGAVDLGGLFGNKVDLKYNDKYDFTSRLYMQTESYDKKDVTKMDMYMYYSSISPSIGIETKSITSSDGEELPVVSSMVMDGENKCFIMLTDMNGTKMGIISPVPDENAETEKAKAPVITKTGNTKVIAGYKCDEYSYKDADSKTSGKLWHSKDAKLKIDRRSWSKAGMPDYYGYEGFREGIILASETYDNKGKLEAKTETKEINPDFPHSISVKGYPLRQMNLNQK
jgi:hypothetical protein